jgi:hypothetical protein
MASISSTAVSSDTIEIEELPAGWETAKVTYRTKDGEIKASVQIIDMLSKPHVQYWHDSMQSISIKCALLVLAIPFFAVANIAFDVVRTTVLVIGTLGRSLCFLLNPRNWGKVDRVCIGWANETSEILAQGACDIARLPVLAIMMQIYCLYGIFYPLEGRLLAGEMERAIKGDSSSDPIRAIAMRKKDLRSVKDVPAALFDLYTNKDSEYRFYWAFCFQPVGLAIVQDNVLRIDRLNPGVMKK